MAEDGQDRRTPTTIEELAASVDRRFDAVDHRFDAVDGRLDGVDRRLEAVDRRFDAVDAAIVEQRQYTEFAFGKLEQELVVVKSGLGRLEQEFVVVKSGLGRVERKLDRLIDAATPSEKPEPD